MATKETPATNAPASPERVYVEIPRAKPGQGYKAPRNYDYPLLALASKVVIVGLCITLPLAPALIFAMILAYDPNARVRFLWIWIPLTIFILLIGFLAAYGVAREALGISGVSFPHPRRASRPSTSEPTKLG
jgi:hypothetical protein